MKAGQIVERIIEYSNPPFKLEHTCDIYTSGGPDTEVRGIVTTFMANADVIREAIKLGANMIVTHEPTFFTGMDRLDWLENDPIYLAKRKLLEDNNMVVWRYHDHMHMKKPDGIYEGLNKELGWEDKIEKRPDGVTPKGPGDTNGYIDGFEGVYVIEETTLQGLSEFFKEKFEMDTVQIIGDPQMKCKRVAVMVGGGSLGLGKEEMPMIMMERRDIDVMVCGEITEWTLCSYVDDAQKLGFNRALLILGHERTEEWGMKYMSKWLQQLVPELNVSFVDAKEPFKYL